MTKSNNLGSVSNERKPISNLTTVTTKTDEIKVVINERTVDKARANSSGILCCVVTTALIGLGVGISIWYAITEL